MKWAEKTVGSKEDLVEYLRNICDQCASGSLAVEGQSVSLPEGEIEFKIKFEEEESGGKFSIKASWVNWEYEEKADEEEEEVEG